MKKIISILLVICLFGTIVSACGSSQTAESKSESSETASISEASEPMPVSTVEPTEEPTPEPTEEPTPEPTEEPEEEYDPMVDVIDLTFDEGNIKYVGFEKANKNLTEAKNALVFLFEFTNNQKDPSQAQSVFYIQFFQNGVELTDNPSYSSLGGDQYDVVSAFFSSVMKGGTVTFGEIVVPKDNSPITIMASYNGSSTIDNDYQMMEVDIESETASSLEKYPEVYEALSQNTWLFNGGDDTILNYLTFSEETALIGQVYFDGNGYHDNGTNECEYTIDDSSIMITTDEGGELSVDYTLSDGIITLGDGDYLTLEQIEESIQGYWMCIYHNKFSGTDSKYYICIDNGNLRSEYASEAIGGSDGEYYYYGPEEGKYTLRIGGFDTNMRHGNDWFFNIIDGNPTILHYDTVCTPADGFPGEYGYSF